VTYNNGTLIKVHRYWRWYQPVSYLSVLIRLFTKSYWNHTAVGVVLGDTRLVHCVLDANQNGVVLEPWDIWVKKYGSKKYEITPSNKEINESDLLKYVGRGYDFLSVFIWQPIYILTGKWLGKTGIDASDKTYCTEIYSFVHGLKDPERITTGDLERMGL